MARIHLQKNGTKTILFAGEDINSITPEANTFFVGTDLATGKYEKLNPNGDIVDLEGGSGTSSIEDITYLELYNLTINNELTPLQWYRLTDYKSVNFINGYEIASLNSNYNGDPPTDPYFIPREVYTGDTEILLLQAKSTNEIAEIGYSETFPSDIIHYQPYTNKIGANIISYDGGIQNGVFLPDSSEVIGFDLQWDGTNVYFDMPVGYPALYGQGFSIEAQFISPTVGGLSSASLSGTAAGVSPNYYVVFPTNISSSGYGAVVIIINNGDGTYSYNYAELNGTNYQVNDTLLIVGSKVGGSDGVNDIILTVDSINGFYGQSGVFFTKPGILSPNISLTKNNLVNLPKQTSRIQIEDNGQKIVLLDLTNDDVNNYQVGTLLVRTVFEIGDSYGLIMNRRDTLRNVEAPLDFRGRKYRRFITDLSSYNPALGVGYYGQGDNYYGLSTTGEYADFKVFENATNLKWEGLAIGNTGIGENDNNVIFGSINDTTIKNGFANNTFGSPDIPGVSTCENVFIDNFFRRNTISKGFKDNTIGTSFFNNTIGYGFRNNYIDTDNFRNNIIELNFQRNTVTATVNGINFSGATHVYQNYNCQIFLRQGGDNRLSYIDSSDVVQYSAVTS
jgi:hypothetical protein